MDILDRIISEKINRMVNSTLPLNEGFFEGDNKVSSARKKQDEYERKHGKSEISSMTKGATQIGLERGTNVAAMAEKLVDDGVWDCSKISAQSKLRKKIRGEKAPNGGHYGLTPSEAAHIEGYADEVNNGQSEKR